MREYRFDYTVIVAGRGRSSVKTLKAYSWLDAAQRLASHACKHWAQPPIVKVNNAEVDGGLINPDLLPEIRGAVTAKVESEYRTFCDLLSLRLSAKAEGSPQATLATDESGRQEGRAQ